MSRSNSLLSILTIIFASTSYVTADIREDAKVIDVSGGEDHTLVLTHNGWAWACGLNAYYQIGIGETTSYQSWLVHVHDGDMNTYSNYLENIIEVAAGWKHSLALDINGFIWAWGDNHYGQLGNNKQ
jgi:alpha-tubulin suppressor-like RCC1 family protein